MTGDRATDPPLYSPGASSYHRAVLGEHSTAFERYFEELVLVPAGTFLQGPTLRPVYLDAFSISVFPVTNMQYQRFVVETGHAPPPLWVDGRVPPGRELHPVVMVAWHDALAYARFRGLDLPSEQQWEKAARGTDGRIYPWGSHYDRTLCNSYSAGFGDTTPVNAFPRGASPYGCYDMAGNVWEWTDSDLLEGHRSRCGGSHLNYGIADCRCDTRSYFPESTPSLYGGFRCMRS